MRKITKVGLERNESREAILRTQRGTVTGSITLVNHEADDPDGIGRKRTDFYIDTNYEDGSECLSVRIPHNSIIEIQRTNSPFYRAYRVSL